MLVNAPYIFVNGSMLQPLLGLSLDIQIRLMLMAGVMLRKQLIEVSKLSQRHVCAICLPSLMCMIIFTMREEDWH